MTDKKPKSNDTGEDMPLTPIQKAQAAAKASKAGTHDPFARINALPPEQLELVVGMLRGHSPALVARTIQQDWGQCLDVTELTLAHQLERFRAAKIPASELLNPYVISKLTESYRKSVNVISEQSALVEMQMERLRQARPEEVEAGELLKTVDRQAALLNRLLKTLADIGYKAGLLNQYMADFNRFHEADDADVTFTLQKLYFSTFRRMQREDPEGFEAATMP